MGKPRHDSDTTATRQRQALDQPNPQVWERIDSAARRLTADREGIKLRSRKQAVWRELKAGRLTESWAIPSGPFAGTYVRRAEVTALVRAKARAQGTTS